jgi:hypothetical protein
MKKTFTPQLKHLLYLASLAQAVLFAIAGNQYFGVFGWLAGLVIGAVVNISLAVASSRISDISEKRKPLARLALIGMFLLSPTTITLTLFAPASIATAIVWSMDADLAIILTGAIAGKNLVDASGSRTKNGTGKKPKTRKQLAKDTQQPAPNVAQVASQEKQSVARKKIADDELLAYLAGNPGASQQQVADHFGVTRQAIGPRVKKLYEVKS